MECYPSIGMENEQIELPPGFRFHPTDEELITHYLCPKFVDAKYNAVAIGEADLNKIEPWDLPKIAKMGEKEWYFFCVRDRKYPTGMRTNRATKAGYWKATGKDKEIFRAETLVGMKKTLVFYTGRAPKGEKTNWIMHEYRLDGQNAMFNHDIYVKNEWVLSRVFEKHSGAKKTNDNPVSESAQELQLVPVTPLNDHSPNKNETMVMTDTNSSHVTCFSNPLLLADQHQIGTTQETNFESTLVLNPLKPPNSEFLTDEEKAELGCDNAVFGPEQSMSRLLVEGEGLTSNAEFSLEGGLCYVGDIDDELWMF